MDMKFFIGQMTHNWREVEIKLSGGFYCTLYYRHCFAHTNWVWEFFFFMSDNIKLYDKLRCMQRELSDF